MKVWECGPEVESTWVLELIQQTEDGRPEADFQDQGSWGILQIWESGPEVINCLGSGTYPTQRRQQTKSSSSGPNKLEAVKI